MDPGTILSVIEITAKVISLIAKYYSKVKDAKTDIEQLRRKMLAYQNVLQSVHELIRREGPARLPTASVQVVEESRNDITEIEAKLDPGHRQKAMRRVGLTALKWPFTSKEVNGLVAKLEKYMAALNFALNVDQT